MEDKENRRIKINPRKLTLVAFFVFVFLVVRLLCICCLHSFAPPHSLHHIGGCPSLHHGGCHARSLGCRTGAPGPCCSELRGLLIDCRLQQPPAAALFRRLARPDDAGAEIEGCCGGCARVQARSWWRSGGVHGGCPCYSWYGCGVPH